MYRSKSMRLFPYEGVEELDAISPDPQGSDTTGRDSGALLAVSVPMRCGGAPGRTGRTPHRIAMGAR